MKKLLSLLGAIGLVATTGATVVACGETSTKASVQNDVVTAQDYQVATQNLQPSSGTWAEGDLITNLDDHLRGYLNPLFLNLTGKNISPEEINEDYDIQGITAADIKKALDAVEGGSEKAQLTGISVIAKENAKHITGEVTLPNITILKGSSLSDLIVSAEKIVVDSAGYLPTIKEVLDKLNEELASSYPEPAELKPGNFIFEVNRGKIIVIGNGIYHGKITINHNSLLAKDISEVITPNQNNLGKLGFIARPSNQQLFDKLTEIFGEDYNPDNLEIVKSDVSETSLIGRNKLKGEAVVRYERTVFSLNNIINKNLGALNEKPKDKEDLVDQINKVNSGLGLTADLITLGGAIGDTNVYIAAVEGNKLVTDGAVIEWDVKQIDLGTIIKISDLGSLAIKATNDDIVAAVNEKNGLNLVNDKDVTVGPITTTENGGRTAVISAAEGSARYTGSAVVNWAIKPILGANNINDAIKKLKDSNQLNFEIKAGTKAEDAKILIANQIKTLLEADYWLNTPEAFKIDFSVFPTDAELSKPSGHFPWQSQEATMTFTIEKDASPVAVKTNWQINVK